MSADRRHAHLGLLRALTQRMAVGSLLLKGWVLLLVAALLAVAVDPEHARFAWLAVAIAIAFWMLDAHLLRQRRLYHKAHRRARLARDEQIDFSLDTGAVDSGADAWRVLMFSKNLALFYGVLLASILLLRSLFQ